MPRKNSKAIIYWALGTYWVGLFILTSIPGRSLPSVRISDKLVHFGAYFLLGGLFLIAARIQGRFHFLSRRPIVCALVIILLYAALDEWHQQLIPGRDGSIGDWAADLIGTVAGIFFAYFSFGNWIRKNQPRGQEGGKAAGRFE
jgi:VanZ family protein